MKRSRWHTLSPIHRPTPSLTLRGCSPRPGEAVWTSRHYVRFDDRSGPNYHNRVGFRMRSVLWRFGDGEPKQPNYRRGSTANFIKSSTPEKFLQIYKGTTTFAGQKIYGWCVLGNELLACGSCGFYLVAAGRR